MTSALSVRGRRVCAALGVVTLSALVLAACEKPTPLAQITVGTKTASTEAQCYEDGETIPADELEACVKERAGTSITVGEGDRLRVGVDPEVAEDGWMVFVDGQPTTLPRSTTTYTSLNGDSFFNSQSPDGRTVQSDSAKIGIVEVNEDGSYKGAWSFDLKRAGA